MALFNGSGSDICPRWSKNHLLQLAWYGPTLFNATALKALIEGRIKHDFGGKAVIVTDVAIHGSFNQQAAYSLLYEPLANITRDSRIPLVLMTPHTPQANKPAAFQKTQGQPVVRAWNARLHAFAESHGGVPVLDTWALTYNASSYDGTHYGSAVNLLLAQTFLNWLAG